MIHYVVTERFSRTIATFLRNTGRDLAGTLRLLTYEELFFERAGPIGHYVFTDFDRLSRYELDTVARFATGLQDKVPDARILNHPGKALERMALLVALRRAGINDFTATRLDTGERPPHFPVFIRAEDGHDGPETELVDEADFDRSLAELRARGIPLRGRIAIGFAAEKGANGRFRKFGAFNIGGTVIPQHLIQSDGWAIKRRVPGDTTPTAIDTSAESVDEELEYIRSNPHRDAILRAFNAGSIECGRADYGVVDGKVQIYEINTNPEFPRFEIHDHRSECRSILRGPLIDAFRAIDTPIGSTGSLRLSETRPRSHNLHLPRFRLPISILRRLGRKVSSGRRQPDSNQPR